MRKSRFTEEKIVKLLNAFERGAKPDDVCRRHRVSKNTLYRCKAKYGGKQIAARRMLLCRLMLIAALASAGCSSRSTERHDPWPSPVLQLLRHDVETQRALRFATPVALRYSTPAEICSVLPYGPLDTGIYVAAEAQVFLAISAITSVDTWSLRSDVTCPGVLATYDPRTRTIYARRDMSEPAASELLRHELHHALSQPPGFCIVPSCSVTPKVAA